MKILECNFKMFFIRFEWKGLWKLMDTLSMIPPIMPILLSLLNPINHIKYLIRRINK